MNRIVFWSGLCVAGGFAGVTVVSLLYGVASPATVLPIPAVSIDMAMQGAIASKDVLINIGNIGVASDLVLAFGACLLAYYFSREKQNLKSTGWLLIGLSAVIFFVVDLIAGFVLGPVALSSDVGSFITFKHWFDRLFIAGAMIFGCGAVFSLWVEVRSDFPIVNRTVSILGIMTGLAAIVAALSLLLGFNLSQVLGLSILAGSIVFLVVGLQISRAFHKPVSST